MTEINGSQPVKIQIQKGMGLTQTLKKLVEDQGMELSDGKITAKEWSSVMDKLAEIQQNRKANNQTSIFSGGTDKSKNGGRTNFVVQAGQEIEFTAAEMNILYGAMGAKFKNSYSQKVDSDQDKSKHTEPAETAVQAQDKPKSTDNTQRSNTGTQSKLVGTANVKINGKDVELSAYAPVVSTENKSSDVTPRQDLREKIDITKDFVKNPDGTFTRTVTDETGRVSYAETVDKDGRMITNTEYKVGIKNGSKIDIQRNYYEDGSIERIAFLNGEKLDFLWGEDTSVGELLFKIKDSMFKFDSKKPTEADLTKLGFIETTNMTTGDKCFINPRTQETVYISDDGKTCSYTKGILRQIINFDDSGNSIGGGVTVVHKDEMETIKYDRDVSTGEIEIIEESVENLAKKV